jgi:hypothetical protein
MEPTRADQLAGSDPVTPPGLLAMVRDLRPVMKLSTSGNVPDRQRPDSETPVTAPEVHVTPVHEGEAVHGSDPDQVEYGFVQLVL